LAVASAEMKEIWKFVVTPAKAVRRAGIFKPTHRSISAFGPAMILLDPIVIRHNFCRRRRWSGRLGPPAVFSGDRDRGCREHVKWAGHNV
jgi:hypothetical protein